MIQVVQAKTQRDVLYIRSFTCAGDDDDDCVCDHGCNPQAAPDKRELIIPDCTGCFSEGGFQFALAIGHGHNGYKGTFLSKPSPLSLQPLSHTHLLSCPGTAA